MTSTWDGLESCSADAPVAQPSVNILNKNNPVVNDNTDRHRDSPKGHNIDRLPPSPEHEHRQRDRQRNRRQRDDRRADVHQEEHEDDGNDDGGVSRDRRYVVYGQLDIKSDCRKM